MVSCSYNPSSGEAETGVSGSCWPASLAYASWSPVRYTISKLRREMKFQGVLCPLSPLPLSLTLSLSFSFFLSPSPLSHMHMHTHMYLHIHKQPLHSYTSFFHYPLFFLPITLQDSHILGSSPLFFTGKEMSPKLSSLLLSSHPVLLRAQASRPYAVLLMKG